MPSAFIHQLIMQYKTIKTLFAQQMINWAISPITDWRVLSHKRQGVNREKKKKTTIKTCWQGDKSIERWRWWRNVMTLCDLWTQQQHVIMVYLSHVNACNHSNCRTIFQFGGDYYINYSPINAQKTTKNVQKLTGFFPAKLLRGSLALSDKGCCGTRLRNLSSHRWRPPHPSSQCKRPTQPTYNVTWLPVKDNPLMPSFEQVICH